MRSTLNWHLIKNYSTLFFIFWSKQEGKTICYLFWQIKKGSLCSQARNSYLLQQREWRKGNGCEWGFFFFRALFPLIFLIGDGATIEGKGHFLCCFFCLCKVLTQRRGRSHLPHTHWKTPILIIWFFSKKIKYSEIRTYKSYLHV